MSKTVHYTLDLSNPPPLTQAQKDMLAALEHRPIDYSDLPPLDEKFWQNAARNPFLHRPPKLLKTSTTVRVDADVLAWLKSQGRGYQTRINAILREKMLATLEQTEEKAKV